MPKYVIFHTTIIVILIVAIPYGINYKVILSVLL